MKPGRTLGVSLAIFASVMLFSILPLMQVAMVLILRYRMQSVNLPDGTSAVQPIAVGGDYTGVTDLGLVLQSLLGVVFIIIAVFAWRGRPAWIRLALLVAVLVLTVVTVALSILPLISGSNLNAGIDSGAAIVHTLLSSRLAASLLVALYVVWYMNRGPARAFYRGYYLTEPDEAAPKT